MFSSVYTESVYPPVPFFPNYLDFNIFFYFFDKVISDAGQNYQNNASNLFVIYNK